MSRRAVAIESAIARWLAVRGTGDRVARLVGGPARVRLVGSATPRSLANAALAELRIAGVSITVAASAAPIQALAQQLLGGPPELPAPRPPTVVEHAIWSLVVAAAAVDLGIAAVVSPLAGAGIDDRAHVLELAVDLAGTPLTVFALCPRELVVRAPPPRPIPAWTFDLPVIVARCALPREAVRSLAVRDVVTVEPDLALALGGGLVRLRAAPEALEVVVASGYVGRAMALPDDAHLELTVQLGTTRLSLRQLTELAVGQVVPLGRPLAGPYEIHAAGRQVGEGELVDVDGELGVRIVSLTQE